MSAMQPVKVTAAIITNGGKVFIAKRKLTGRMPGLWEFPGGRVEVGETPEQCLKRELYEEFEIDVEVGQFLGFNTHNYDFGTIELMAFRASIIVGELKMNDHAEMAWVKPGDLGKYDFAPADVPFVQSIRRGDIEL